MEQAAIFEPVFALLVLTIVVWFVMFARRIPWIQSSNLSPEQFKPGEFERAQPEHVLNPSSNFKNLFEIPVLFYVLAVYLYATGNVDSIYLWSAWLFVITRYVHSLIHCTFNHVMTRFVVYLAGTLTLFLMIGRALIGLI